MSAEKGSKSTEALASHGCHKCGFVDTGIFRDPPPNKQLADLLQMFLEATEQHERDGTPLEELFKNMLDRHPTPTIEDTVLKPVEMRAKKIVDRYSKAICEIIDDDLPDGSDFRKQLEKTIDFNSRVIPFDAPPIAHDAEQCLSAVELVRTAIRNGDAEQAALHAARVGHLDLKITVRAYEPIALQGRALLRHRRNGGKATARVNEQERKAIVLARNDLAKTQGRSKTWAAGMIASQLRTGTFPGINRAVEYTTKYVANLRAAR